MMRHDLASEQFTVLPKRFETRKSFNLAFVEQTNTSIQAAGVGVGGDDGTGVGIAENVLQLSEQTNAAVILQNVNGD